MKLQGIAKKDLHFAFAYIKKNFDRVIRDPVWWTFYIAMIEVK